MVSAGQYGAINKITATNPGHNASKSGHMPYAALTTIGNAVIPTNSRRLEIIPNLCIQL